jgi:hypothetical protein
MTSSTCINPQSGRAITVGGKIWRKLIHEKVIDGDIVAPTNELYVADTKEEAKAAKKVLTKQKPPKKGYINKIDNSGKRVITARKRMKQEALQKYMIKCSQRVMRRERKALSKMDDEDSINKFLSEKVMAMMLDSGKVTEDDIEKFVVEPPESESESDGSQSESESE